MTSFLFATILVGVAGAQDDGLELGQDESALEGSRDPFSPDAPDPFGAAVSGPFQPTDPERPRAVVIHLPLDSVYGNGVDGTPGPSYGGPTDAARFPAGCDSVGTLKPAPPLVVSRLTDQLGSTLQAPVKDAAMQKLGADRIRTWAQRHFPYVVSAVELFEHPLIRILVEVATPDDLAKDADDPLAARNAQLKVALRRFNFSLGDLIGAAHHSFTDKSCGSVVTAVNQAAAELKESAELTSQRAAFQLSLDYKGCTKGNLEVYLANVEQLRNYAKDWSELDHSELCGELD